MAICLTLGKLALEDLDYVTDFINLDTSFQAAHILLHTHPPNHPRTQITTPLTIDRSWLKFKT